MAKKTQFVADFTQPEQTPEQFFDQIRQAQEKEIYEEEKGRKLAIEEERKMQDGFAVDEMMKSAGWAVVQDILLNASMHTWVDPRGTSKEEWEWQELNAYHAANNARELMEGLSGLVQEAHRLHGVKVGDSQEQPRMRF